MKEIEYEDLKDNLKTYFKKEEISLIDKYYEEAKKIYSGMKRQTGEDYIYHPINVAYSLALNKMDPVTVGCALIHEAVSLDKMTLEEIKEKFGEESSVIVSCITKISRIKKTFSKEKNQDRYRRIIVGLAQNPKALFIKFADRLHNLKTLYVKNKKEQKEIIEDTQNILIPIAHRLGVKNIMSELEDYCLQYTDPKGYQKILETINASKDELEECLKNTKEEIVDLLEENNINFEILSRVKSVRGIYNKLKSGKSWNDIYDLLGLRVIVNKPEECYLVLGLIHSTFNSIPKRFKDYIANPKENMYQSLHTTIFGGEDKRIYEVQIRTYEMDEIAEKGVASHWSYKEKTDGKTKDKMEEKLENFRSLIELQDLEKNKKFFNQFNKEIIEEEIYVFTPKGDIIELPKGSTPIDFAYKIHSEVGDTTVSAIVNNKIVKLDHKLQNDDIVSLNTLEGKAPSRDWLKFVKTEQARNRIKSYFYKNDRAKYIVLGKEMLHSEAKKKKIELTNENILYLLKELKIDNEDELYFSISILKYLPASIINKIISNQKQEKNIKENINKKDNQDKKIIVEGVENIKTTFAPCCNPVFGEEIVGYVTKGYGVKIHSKKCKHVNLNSKRIVSCSWNNKIEQKSTSILKIFIDEQNDNLVDIINTATKFEISVDSINLKDHNKNNPYYLLQCRVKNINLLNEFINAINNLKFVYSVERSAKE